MRVNAILFLSTLLFFTPACGEKQDVIVNTPPEDKPVHLPVTRSESILIADQYARVHWFMSKTNQTGISCGDTFSSDYPTGYRVGMGYKWGGWDDVVDFLFKIDEGYGTGTGGGANTYDHYSIDCVVGISCTGLVSRAWRLSQKYTLCYADPDIPRKLCEISDDILDVDFSNHDMGGLKKGDAFINEFHTILFVYETRDGYLCIIDSSTDGVRFRRITWEHLNDYGYKAIRYRDIKEISNPRGTIDNPTPIKSTEFPVRYQGNTRDVVSMWFDRYSVDPGTSQVGPEFIYTLEMTSAGTIKVLLTDIKNEGINNDIYLLGSLDRLDEVRLASNCIAGGDDTMTSYLEPGTYYLVVDSSLDMPGEYTLFIDFE